VQDEAQILEWLALAHNGALDDFDALLKHLAKVHPSKYGLILEGIDRLGLLDVHILKDQAVALRFVSFVDRAYEQQVAIRGSGIDTTKIFTEEHLNGGYRKKYLRAVSRLGALAG
jgi:cell division protein ZapE